MELEYSTFELAPVLDDAVSMMRERAAAHGDRPRVEIETDGRTVYADELRLKQVVAQPDEQRREVHRRRGHGAVVRASRGRRDRHHRHRHGYRRPGRGPRAHLRVVPAGWPGAARRRARGSGSRCRVGSSSCSAAGCGWRARSASAAPSGSRCPLRRRRWHQATDFGGRERVGDVVVIEDDRPSLDLLTAYLSRCGAARHGRPRWFSRARPPCAASGPTAVFLDIRLPGIDGWAVLEALKADPETRDIPVIVASIVDERARGVALGAAAYLVKPVSRDALLAALSDIGVRWSGPPRQKWWRAMTPSRILVVEDNPKNLKLVQGRAAALRLRGHRGDDRRGRRAAGSRDRRPT